MKVGMPSQQHDLVSKMTASRLQRKLSSLFFLLACSCSINVGFIAKPVQASNIGNPRPSTVRPIPRKKTRSSPRLPFLPTRNSRRAAKKAYLRHLQNELESAQRQLYVSQNTCNSLRTRCEDQRKTSLQNIAGRANQEKVEQQEEEINQLQGKLQSENDKYKQQLERFNLLSEELKELQVWKVEQEKLNEGKIAHYVEQLQESHTKQSDYEEQVKLLSLKLEAAEFAAKQSQTGKEGRKESTWELRAQELRSDLESVRGKYSTLLINSMQESSKQEGEGGADQQQEIELEMDKAIQSAVESALEAVEKEWEMKYETLEDQMSNMTKYMAGLEEERDTALSQIEKELASSIQSESKEEQSKLKQQQEQLKEELALELTGTLTEELTEKLTNQLTDTLTEKLERKYKKQLKRLNKELKEQQATALEEDQSQEDAVQQQQQKIELEVEKAKEQYQLEYQSKLQELEAQNEEQVQVQKERMRKLVRALLEREAKQKGKKDGKNQFSPKKKKRKSSATSDSESSGTRGDGEELVSTSSLSSSRKKNYSSPGRVPVRGGNR